MSDTDTSIEYLYSDASASDDEELSDVESDSESPGGGAAAAARRVQPKPKPVWAPGQREAYQAAWAAKRNIQRWWPAWRVVQRRLPLAESQLELARLEAAARFLEARMAPALAAFRAKLAAVRALFGTRTLDPRLRALGATIKFQRALRRWLVARPTPLNDDLSPSFERDARRKRRRVVRQSFVPGSAPQWFAIDAVAEVERCQQRERELRRAGDGSAGYVGWCHPHTQLVYVSREKRALKRRWDLTKDGGAKYDRMLERSRLRGLVSQRIRAYVLELSRFGRQ